MQLSEIRTMLRRRVGNPTSGQATDSFLDQIINIAYRDVANRFRFHQSRLLFSFSTVVGTQSYDLPSDCRVLLRVRNTTQNYEGKLEKLGDRRVAEITDEETDGTPTQYARYNNKLYLYPTPDQIYTLEIYYKQELTDLAADADIPVIPTSWHYGIVLLARFYYFDDQGETAKAIAANNIYDNWVSNQPDELDEEKVDFDSGVSIPTLENWGGKRLDFDHSD